MQERNEVSLHEVLVWRMLEAHADEWLSATGIASELVGRVSYRTVRAHLANFAALGIVAVAEVSPGHRYRISPKSGKRWAEHVTRLQSAAEVFGV